MLPRSELLSLAQPWLLQGEDLLIGGIGDPHAEAHAIIVKFLGAVEGAGCVHDDRLQRLRNAFFLTDQVSQLIEPQPLAALHCVPPDVACRPMQGRSIPLDRGKQRVGSFALLASEQQLDGRRWPVVHQYAETAQVF